MSTKNCLFEDCNLHFSTSLETGFERDVHGCFITIKVPRSYVKKLFRYDISPIHLGPNHWGLRVKINNRTKTVLNGRKMDYYDGSILKDVPLSKWILNEIVVKRYGKRLKDAYECDCYATRIVIRELV